MVNELNKMNMNYRILIAFMILVGSSSGSTTTINTTASTDTKGMLLALKNPHVSDKEVLKFLKDPKKDKIDFYRFDLEMKQNEKMRDIKSDKACEALKSEDGALYAKIEKQVEEKAESLRNILKEEPWIKSVYDKKDQYDNDLKDPDTSVSAAAVLDERIKNLHAHFENFIAKSVEFDAKRQTFSNLHKAIESLRASYEVARKGDARMNAMKNFNLEKPKETKTVEFTIKTSEDKGIWEKYFSNFEDKPCKNILQAGLDASNASTSEPATLGYFFALSTAIATILLVMKFMSINSKKMEEDE